MSSKRSCALMKSPQQQGAGQARLADAGGADEDQVLGAFEEVERGELEERRLANAGLELLRVGVQCPATSARAGPRDRCRPTR